MNNCLFCSIENDLEQKIVLSNQYCMFLQKPQEILIGSGVIVPKRHRKTVFDLSEDEWNATFDLLKEVKVYIDNKYKPQGYNIGWNVNEVGGQCRERVLDIGLNSLKIKEFIYRILSIFRSQFSYIITYLFLYKK